VLTEGLVVSLVVADSLIVVDAEPRVLG